MYGRSSRMRKHGAQPRRSTYRGARESALTIIALVATLVLLALAPDSHATSDAVGLADHGDAANSAPALASSSFPWGDTQASARSNGFRLAIGVLFVAVASVALFARADDSPPEAAAFFEHSPDMTCALSLDGQLLRVNQAWANVLGHPPDALVGSSLLDLAHPDDEAVLRSMLRVLATNPKAACDARHRTADGSYRCIAWKAVSVSEERCIYAFGRDITAQRTMEAELHALNQELEGRVDERAAALTESEGRFQDVFDASPIGMTLVGSDGTFRHANTAFANIFGYDIDQLHTLSMGDLVGPEDVVTEHVRSSRTAPLQADQECVRGDGSTVWTRVTSTMLHVTEAVDPYRLVMVQDISARKDAELLSAVLHDISEAVHTSTDLTAMYRSMYASVTRMIPAPSFVIALAVDGPDHTYEFAHWVHEGREQTPQRVTIPRSRVAFTASQGETTYHTRADTARMVGAAEMEHPWSPAGAYLGVPLTVDDRQIGVIGLVDPAGIDPYSPRDVEMVTYIGAQIALAIDRRRAHEDLSHERRLFDSLMDNVPDSVYLKDRDLRFLRVNRVAAQQLGLADPADAVGLSDADVYPPGQADTYRDAELRIARTAKPLVGLVERAGDGWGSTTKAPLLDEEGEFAGIVGISRDITDLMETQIALRESETHRTQLIEQMLSVGEVERARIALELHDQIGQELTSVLLGLKIIQSAVTLDDAKRQAADLASVTAETLEDVRQIAFDMRPGSLEDLGLEPALRRDIADVAQAAGLDAMIDFVIADAAGLSTETELGIYRLVHAALTNIAQHARAKTVSVTMRVREHPSGQRVSVLVEDDGIGFAAADVLAGPVEGRFGLLAMQERSRILGGSVTFESTPGGGATVLIDLPAGA